MSDYSSPAESLHQSFAALATTQHLRPGTKKYRKARERFIVEEFDDYFGEDTKLGNWQKLCLDLGMEDPPQSITQCRKALNQVWVNIWDLLSAVRQGKQVKMWRSQSALAKYTRENRKYYPKEKAKECGPVRALLAHISYA